MPAIPRAIAGAASPAALTSTRHPNVSGSAPPVPTTKPFSLACAETNGLRNAIIAPAASASPCRLSISAWPSTMPVEGDSSAPFTASAGSNACAAAPVSTCRSSTPFAAARALIDASVATSPSSAATISLPQRRCGTPRSAQ